MSRLLNILMVFSLLISFVQVQAQTKVKILDNEGNELIGAHVTFSGMDKKVSQTILSDLDGIALIPGDFSNENPSFILKIAYVGYETRMDTVKSNTSFSVRLKVDKVNLNQVVITGQYSPNNPEKSVHKIKIIDRATLDSRGVVNLNDALQFETNMRISQDNMLGSAASVQGISGENVKIMIDGVPVIGRQDGNIDLNQINLNNIERIEIVEGPLSVNYGTNALAGTINLITKKDKKNTYSTSVNSYYESVGQYNLDANLAYKKGNHTVITSGGRNYFDGWSPGEGFSLGPKERQADTNRNLQWNPKEQLFANVQYTYRKEKTSYRLFADLFDETIINRGNPRKPYNLTAFDEYFYTKRIMTGIDIQGRIKEDWNWSVLGSYSHYDRARYTYFKNLSTLNEGLTGDPDDHDTTNIQTWMSRGVIRHIPLAVKVNWELGYDFNREVARGKRIENNVQSIGDYAIFGTMEWKPFSFLLVKPGLRYAYNTSYNAPVIPSVNLRYQRSKIAWRFSYAMGFRAPSLKELYFEFVDINHNIYGNPNLKAESSNNFQFDASYKITKSQRLTSFDMGFFFNKITNMISLAQVGFSQDYTYINIGKYRTQGIDLSVSHSVNHWKFSAGFVYTGRANSVEDSSIANNIFYSPELRGIASYEFKKIGGNLAFYYKYNGEIPVYSIGETGGTTESFSAPYQMLDITATKYLWKKRLHWSFGIKNLLDVQNISTAGTAGNAHNAATNIVPISWGRTFFTSFKFNFGWN